MGKSLDEMTHEDWKMIVRYLMRANELKARVDRGQDTIPLNDPYVIEFKEAAEEITDDTWLRFGFFAGREAV